ncbi:hypothetical protein ACIBKY_43630 [Nonomuraea sp. NPDC050394]|uniref:hypothetical protein n=1 Tax=Nonomuraea sp. NPDC050394 TaxID=3364363 RepID=UPI0037B99BF4
MPSRNTVLIAAALTALSVGVAAWLIVTRDTAPAAQSVSTVGPDGERVAFEGGWIEIPPGAISSPTTLRVRPAAAMPPSAPVTGLTDQLGTGISVDLSGTQPAKPLRLGLSLTGPPAGIPADRLAIATAPQGGPPRLLPAGYDEAGRTLVAEIDHLSDFWAVATDDAAIARQVATFAAQMLKQRAPEPSGETSIESVVSFAPGDWGKPPDPWLWGTLADGDGEFTASVTNNRPVGFVVVAESGMKVRQDLPSSLEEGFTRLAYLTYKAVYGDEGAVLTAGSQLGIAVPHAKLSASRDPGGLLARGGPLKIATVRPHLAVYAALVIQVVIIDVALVLSRGSSVGALSIAKALETKGTVNCVAGALQGLGSAITDGPAPLSDLLVGQQIGVKCVSALTDAVAEALDDAGGLVTGKPAAFAKLLARVIDVVTKNMSVLTAAWELTQLPQSFELAVQPEQGENDWRNRSYYLNGDDLSAQPRLIDIADGTGAGGGWEVGIEQIAEGRIARLGKVTAVLFRIRPVPGNFFTQELRVFHRDGRYIGRVPTLVRERLYPWFQPGTTTFPGGLLAAEVKFYAPGDSHASGPSIKRTVRWRWDGTRFLLHSGLYRPEPSPTPSPVTGDTMEVQSAQGWQDTGIDIAGKFNVSDLNEGTWTVDHRNHPYVDAGGYSAADDQRIAQGYKYDAGRPYGYLLGRLGQRVFPVGGGGLFEHTGDRPARLYLRINDADQALGDNAGSIKVDINPWPS